jgi:hypothetical protein
MPAEASAGPPASPAPSTAPAGQPAFTAKPALPDARTFQAPVKAWSGVNTRIGPNSSGFGESQTQMDFTEFNRARVRSGLQPMRYAEYAAQRNGQQTTSQRPNAEAKPAPSAVAGQGKPRAPLAPIPYAARWLARPPLGEGKGAPAGANKVEVKPPPISPRSASPRDRRPGRVAVLPARVYQFSNSALQQEGHGKCISAMSLSGASTLPRTCCTFISMDLSNAAVTSMTSLIVINKDVYDVWRDGPLADLLPRFTARIEQVLQTGI